MRQTALHQFHAKYKYQIQAQFPKDSISQDDGVPLQCMHNNAVKIVQHFQGMWNRREKALDRKQARDVPSTGQQAWLSESEEHKGKPKPVKKRLRKEV